MPECVLCVAITGKRVNREGERERLNAFQSGCNIQSWVFIAHIIKEKTKKTGNHLACTLLPPPSNKDQISGMI